MNIKYHWHPIPPNITKLHIVLEAMIYLCGIEITFLMVTRPWSIVIEFNHVTFYFTPIQELWGCDHFYPTSSSCTFMFNIQRNHMIFQSHLNASLSTLGCLLCIFLNTQNDQVMLSIRQTSYIGCSSLGIHSILLEERR